MSTTVGYVSFVFEKGSGEDLVRLDITGFKTNENAISIHEVKPNDKFEADMLTQPFDLGFEYNYSELTAEFVTRQQFTTAQLIDGDDITDLTA